MPQLMPLYWLSSVLLLLFILLMLIDLYCLKEKEKFSLEFKELFNYINIKYLW